MHRYRAWGRDARAGRVHAKVGSYVFVMTEEFVLTHICWQKIARRLWRGISVHGYLYADRSSNQK
jgi:hypothetical protein